MRLPNQASRHKNDRPKKEQPAKTPKRQARQESKRSEVWAGGQFIDGSYSNQAGSRSYKLYIPSRYSGQALPLVVMLHGCSQTPDDFAAGSRMNLIASKPNSSQPSYFMAIAIRRFTSATQSKFYCNGAKKICA
jgi:hypothetical protein